MTRTSVSRMDQLLPAPSQLGFELVDPVVQREHFLVQRGRDDAARGPGHADEEVAS